MALAAIETLNQMFCSRCGRKALACVHLWTTEGVSFVTDPAHATRISARYEWGKLFNPDHDTTSYTDQRGPAEGKWGDRPIPPRPEPGGREISTGVDTTPDRAELLLP